MMRMNRIKKYSNELQNQCIELLEFNIPKSTLYQEKSIYDLYSELVDFLVNLHFCNFDLNVA